MRKDLPIIIGQQYNELPVGRISIDERIEAMAKEGLSFTLYPCLVHRDNESQVIGFSMEFDPVVQVNEQAVTLRQRGYRRLLSCIEQWPECHEGGYDPKCCRFPKSCSCLAQVDEYVASDMLEPE